MTPPTCTCPNRPPKRSARRSPQANGFNQPLLTQLVDYFKGVVHLDFGTSLRTGQSASEMALRAFPATLQLAFTTMLLAIVGR